MCGCLCMNYYFFISIKKCVCYMNKYLCHIRIVTYRRIETFRYFTYGLSTCCFEFKVASLLSMGHIWVTGQNPDGSYGSGSNNTDPLSALVCVCNYEIICIGLNFTKIFKLIMINCYIPYYIRVRK